MTARSPTDAHSFGASSPAARRRVTFTHLQAAWLLLVLTGVVLVAFVDREHTPPMAAPRVTAAQTTAIVTSRRGERAIADAGGQLVPLRDYRRIAATSIVADGLLLALAEPERVVALSHYGREAASSSYRYGDRVPLHGLGDVELLRKLEIDLVLAHHLGAPAELARARETGAQVFNLGDMRGLATLVPNIEAVALLLGDRERGVRLAQSFQRRMRAVAADVPRERRKRALYVSAYGGQLFGGAANTSYHDVLEAAGLVDVAAERFTDWPHYDPEQLLELDPEVIVTTEASVPLLCRTSGLGHLRACGRPNAIVGLPETRIGDPGLGMLEAAEEIRARVYGAP
jgi:iron complex transport system substrate-binding protein